MNVSCSELENSECDLVPPTKAKADKKRKSTDKPSPQQPSEEVPTQTPQKQQEGSADADRTQEGRERKRQQV